MEQKKHKYVKPQIEVYELEQSPQLLVGSGLGNPGNYDNGGDPFNPEP